MVYTINIEKLRERFWDKVNLFFGITDEDCWNWIGSMTRGGYGDIRVHTKLVKKATHVSWFLKTGVWPKQHMLHKCDNPACINPSHLFEGDDQDNMTDRINKGQPYNQGEYQGNSKLT